MLFFSRIQSTTLRLVLAPFSHGRFICSEWHSIRKVMARSGRLCGFGICRVTAWEHRIAKKKQHHKLRSIHQIIQIHLKFTKWLFGHAVPAFQHTATVALGPIGCFHPSAGSWHLVPALPWPWQCHGWPKGPTPHAPGIAAGESAQYPASFIHSLPGAG